MTDVVRSEGDPKELQALMQRGRLDLLRPCPGCGVLIDETRSRCKRCQDFAERSRTVTDADFAKAVADGLIVPAKTEGGAP